MKIDATLTKIFALESDSRSLQTAACLLLLTLMSAFLMPMSVDALLGLWLAGVFLIQRPAHPDIVKLRYDPLFLLTLFLLTYFGVSAFWSPEAGLKNLVQLWLRITYIFVFLTCMVAAFDRIPQFENRLVVSVAASAAVSALLCIIAYVIDTPADERLTGLFRFNNPGKAGRAFCAAFPFAMLLVCASRGKTRALGAVALGLLLLALYLTDTRAAWLAVIFTVLVLLLSQTLQRARNFALMFCSACLLGVLLLNQLLQIEVVNELLLPRGESFRLSIWKANLARALEANIWLGASQLVDPRVVVDGHSFRGAHNMYLSVFMQGGVVGLMAFLGVVLVTTLRLMGNMHRSLARLGLCLLIGGAVAFIFGGDRIIDKVNYVWLFLWLPVAIALSMHPPTLSNEGNAARSA